MWSQSQQRGVSLHLLQFLLRPEEGAPSTGQHLCVEQCAQEDDGGAQPVPDGEGVVEVEDGEDEADKLAQRHHQGDSE